MAATLGRFVWTVTVSAANTNINVTETGGSGTFNAAIAATTYATPELLAAAMKTTLDTAGTHTYTVTVGSTGLITISANGTFQINGYAATRANYLIGFHAATSAGTSHTADQQHQGGFYFGETGPDLSVDTEDQPEIDSQQDVSLDGHITERPVGSVKYTREIEIGFADRAHTYKTTNYAKSWEDLWEYIRGGNSRYVAYAPDASSITNTNYHIEPEPFMPKRRDPSVELWSWNVSLRKHV
jgi:hypothetical protein